MYMSFQYTYTENKYSYVREFTALQIEVMLNFLFVQGQLNYEGIEITLNTPI